jgi:sigma-E factor negative regulatory protein RseB
VITLLPPGRRLSSAGLAIGLLTVALAAVTMVETTAGLMTQDNAPTPAAPRPPAANTPAARAGLRLLSAAATAALAVPYSGEQLVRWWGPRNTSRSVIQVWHPRNGTVRATVADLDYGVPPGMVSPGTEDPDSVLSISPQTVALIRAHYAVATAGRGWVDGRPARIVQLTRPDGSLAARFWLDQSTRLLLRRDTFDTRSQMIGEDAFTGLRIGAAGLGGMPVQGVSEWPAQLDGNQLAQLRADGWPVPGGLPDGLTLLTARRSSQVIDLDYSDGLAVVSVFVERGELPAVLPGWREIAMAGSEVYSSDPDQRSLSWSANGFVCTVIAEAPSATVSDVVAAMPHNPARGFWGRIAHGFKRLGSWANPFR